MWEIGGIEILRDKFFVYKLPGDKTNLSRSRFLINEFLSSSHISLQVPEKSKSLHERQTLLLSHTLAGIKNTIHYSSSLAHASGTFNLKFTYEQLHIFRADKTQPTQCQ